MIYLIQTMIDAISYGSFFALVALGIGITFGIMRLVNFAHGELIMIGGYTLFSLTLFPPVVAILGAVIVVVLVAVVIERVAFRPVRNAPPSTLLITSFAMSFALQNLIMIIFDPQPKGFVVAPWITESLHIGEIQIERLAIISIAITSVVVVVLALLLKHTRTGIQMRAAADNFQVARLLGVSANRVIVIGFVASGILAALASVVLVARTGGVKPDMGMSVLLFALVGMVVGGMERLVGVTVGGFLVGFAISGLSAWLPGGLAEYRDAFVAAAAIGVLMLRPQGLFARAERRRV